MGDFSCHLTNTTKFITVEFKLFMRVELQLLIIVGFFFAKKDTLQWMKNIYTYGPDGESLGVKSPNLMPISVSSPQSRTKDEIHHGNKDAMAMINSILKLHDTCPFPYPSIQGFTQDEGNHPQVVA
jgi:hypothetical protein